jgi:hypothetical protein
MGHSRQWIKGEVSSQRLPVRRRGLVDAWRIAG